MQNNKVVETHCAVLLHDDSSSSDSLKRGLLFEFSFNYYVVVWFCKVRGHEGA